MLNGLDLFSGIGGLGLALAEWVRPIAYCENDRYAQAVLLSRMRDGQLPQAPIWDDITTLVSSVLPGEGTVDIIYGGFPCQDISAAGRGKGLAGERSGLVREIFRLVGEIRPRFVFLENVPAIRTRGASVVVGELARLGYDSRWLVISAAEVGAPHLRKRWFILAHAADDGVGRGVKFPPIRESEGDVANADGARELSKQDSKRVAPHRVSDGGQAFWRNWWATEPDVGRVANGIPQRVDRIRGLGNAVVPAQAREAFMRLSGLNQPRPDETRR